MLTTPIRRHLDASSQKSCELTGPEKTPECNPKANAEGTPEAAFLTANCQSTDQCGGSWDPKQHRHQCSRSPSGLLVVYMTHQSLHMPWPHAHSIIGKSVSGLYSWPQLQHTEALELGGDKPLVGASCARMYEQVSSLTISGLRAT